MVLLTSCRSTTPLPDAGRTQLPASGILSRIYHALENGSHWGISGIVHPWEGANIDKGFRLREIIDKPIPTLPHRLCRIRRIISTGHGVLRIGDGVGMGRAADQRIWARRAARRRRSAQSCSRQAAHYQVRSGNMQPATCPISLQYSALLQWLLPLVLGRPAQ